LIKTKQFRIFNDLISSSNITKTFKEECILQKLCANDNELNPIYSSLNTINLKDEALQLFMRNNFDSISNNQKLNILHTENVFNHNDNNYISNQVNDIASDEVDDHYDLNAYIKINSDLINDIINLENMVKTLTNDQKEVTDYIKKILIIKC
jgi:hypothetical protein